MNKFKIGDKVKVKENFWKIESGGITNKSMKKLVGRTLEVESVYDNGDVYTKQDGSKNWTTWGWDKNWIEPIKEITWSNIVSGNPVVSQGSIEAAEMLTRGVRIITETFNCSKPIKNYLIKHK